MSLLPNSIRSSEIVYIFINIWYFDYLCFPCLLDFFMYKYAYLLQCFFNCCLFIKYIMHNLVSFCSFQIMRMTQFQIIIVIITDYTINPNKMKERVIQFLQDDIERIFLRNICVNIWIMNGSSKSFVIFRPIYVLFLK